LISGLESEMEKELDKEILNTANKLQWALGETLFRAKKLKGMLDKNPGIKDPVRVNLLALINSLNEISNLYRHDIADKIREQIME